MSLSLKRSFYTVITFLCLACNCNAMDQEDSTPDLPESTDSAHSDSVQRLVVASRSHPAKNYDDLNLFTQFENWWGNLSRQFTHTKSEVPMLNLSPEENAYYKEKKKLLKNCLGSYRYEVAQEILPILNEFVEKFEIDMPEYGRSNFKIFGTIVKGLVGITLCHAGQTMDSIKDIVKMLHGTDNLMCFANDTGITADIKKGLTSLKSIFRTKEGNFFANKIKLKSDYCKDLQDLLLFQERQITFIKKRLMSGTEEEFAKGKAWQLTEGQRNAIKDLQCELNEKVGEIQKSYSTKIDEENIKLEYRKRNGKKNKYYRIIYYRIAKGTIEGLKWDANRISHLSYEKKRVNRLEVSAGSNTATIHMLERQLDILSRRFDHQFGLINKRVGGVENTVYENISSLDGWADNSYDSEWDDNSSSSEYGGNDF